MGLEESLLEVSEIRNGTLVVEGADTGCVRRIHQLLQTALFEGTIPHYRPIGLYVKGTVDSAREIITRAPGVSKSYLELFRDMRGVVMSQGKGVLRESLMADEPVSGDDVGFLYADGGDITTDGGFQFAGNPAHKVEMLVQGIPVVRLDEGCELRVIMYRGTGLVNFEEAEYLIKQHLRGTNAMTGYVPVRAVYNLYNDLVLQPFWKLDGNILKFTYKCKVNEKVLTEIINRFAAEAGGEI